MVKLVRDRHEPHVNLYDATTNLSKLVDRAAAGEEIVIAKAGKPKAKLVPYEEPCKRRVFGHNRWASPTWLMIGMVRCRRKIQRYFDGESDPEDLV